MKNNDLRPELDELLSSTAQQAVRDVVRELPEESLSLAWRSQLNERLIQVQPKSRLRTRFERAWIPAVGLALAGCLAMVVTLRNPAVQTQQAPRDIEASLVRSYAERTTMEDLATDGLSIHEVSETTLAADSSDPWTDTDLDSL